MTKDDLPTNYMYERQGPWPQPSPSYPGFCADEVLNIPLEDSLSFTKNIGWRYVSSIYGYTVESYSYATWNAAWNGPTADRFDQIMTQTLYTRFRKPMLESERQGCLKNFTGPNDGPLREEIKNGKWYKYDFTAMEMVEPLYGCHCAPVKVFFLKGENDSATAQIIEVQGLHVCRTDSAFLLASLYALQGAAYHVLFVVHPALHFPMDSVAAITRNAVPMSHPLFKLFFPHTNYTLPLDNGALESFFSVVNEQPQFMTYDPLTAKAFNLKLLFGVGYSGLVGQKTKSGKDYDPAAYPVFDYMSPQISGLDPDFSSAYGQWLNDYYNVFLTFCTKVAGKIAKDPVLMQQAVVWANYCSKHVHGFPDGTAIADPQILAKAMAIFTWNASVSHGGDHYSFASQIAPVEYCLRIRTPPPTSRTAPIVYNTNGAIHTEDDRHRAALCRYMFFEAWAVPPNLYNTDYRFTGDLQTAQAAFKADLLAVDTKWYKLAQNPAKPSDPKQIPLFQPLIDRPQDGVLYHQTIPQSIQY